VMRYSDINVSGQQVVVRLVNKVAVTAMIQN